MKKLRKQKRFKYIQLKHDLNTFNLNFLNIELRSEYLGKGALQIPTQ